MQIGYKLKGYLELCRISNLPSIWSNVLCAFMLAGNPFSWRHYLPPALSLSCFYLAGMCLNDICDAAYDRENRPRRPIPSGRVSGREALTVTVILFSAGFGLLLRTPHRQALYAALLLLIVIVWYDFRHKQNPFSVFLMALCRFLVFTVTALAVRGQVATMVLIAGIVQFAYTVSISLVARHENNRPLPFAQPVIPMMLAAISLVDGLLLALFINPVWLLAGASAAFLTLTGQKFIRGD